VRGERVVVQSLDRFRIAREILVLELEHREARGEMTQSLDRGQREPRGRNLKREALAYEAGEFCLVFERVNRGDDTPGAVAKQEHGNARVP
jgi:hypothetical protein